MSDYVGIDVHRKRSQVAVVTGDGTVEFNKNAVNGSEPFRRLIGDLPSGDAGGVRGGVRLGLAGRADPGPPRLGLKVSGGPHRAPCC